MKNEVLHALQQELNARGIEYRVERGGKHFRLYATISGVERYYVVSGTASDRRAALNALTDLRRVFGLQRKCHHSTRVKRKTRNRVDPVALTHITPGKDPWEALRPVQQVAHDFPHLFIHVAQTLNRLEARTDLACRTIRGIS